MISATSYQIIGRAAGAAAKRLRGLTLGEALPAIEGDKMTAVARWKWLGRNLRSLTVEFTEVSQLDDDPDMMPLVFDVALATASKDQIANELCDLLCSQYREILGPPPQIIINEPSQAAV